MASELYVETLKGLTSGANANKVIVPAGQTLDVAGSTSGVNEIKVAEHWHLTSSLTISSTARTTITSNLSRMSTAGHGQINGGITESSGVFTFPSTGIWLVNYNANFYADTDVRVIEIRIEMTQDGGTSFTDKSITQAHITRNNANNTTSSAVCQNLLDITDTSTDKVRFTLEMTNTPVIFQGQDSNPRARNDFMFIRLGDT